MAHHRPLSCHHFNTSHIRPLNRYVRWLYHLQRRRHLANYFLDPLRRIADMADVGCLSSPARVSSWSPSPIGHHDSGKYIPPGTSEEPSVQHLWRMCRVGFLRWVFRLWDMWSVPKLEMVFLHWFNFIGDDDGFVTCLYPL